MIQRNEFFNLIFKAKYSLLLLIFMVSGCTSKYKYSLEKSDHSVVIHQDSVDIKIEVVDDAIIHVRKMITGSKRSSIPDYVTILEPQDVDWKLDEMADKITISTNKMKVIVHSDGIIEYETKDREKLLAETNEYTFIKSKNEGEHTVSQGFIAGDEGLYGLGQFQSGIMNWKNVPIRLQQYNQEIVIPFLVSTKGYGIYWHNCKYTN